MDKRYSGVSLFSGGTDSTVATVLAHRRIGGDILLFTVNLGHSPHEMQKAIDRSKVLQMDHQIHEGTAEFCRDYVSEAIIMNASYQGYPLGTPMGRAYVVNKAVELVGREGEFPRYVIHGCNKRQNTRIRIEKACALYDHFHSLSPLAEKPYTRQDKIDLLAEFGIKVDPQDNFSTDENLWCRAVESMDFNQLGEVEEGRVFKWTINPLKGPEEAETHTLEFDTGLPVALDGRRPPLHQILTSLKDAGARHGVGRVYVIEDTVFDEKIRDVYEAPGPVILRKVHGFLEECVLPRPAREHKAAMENRWGELLYWGDWHTGERRWLGREGRRLQEHVSGSVTFQLYKGNVFIISADIPHSLLLKPHQDRGTY